MRDGGFLRQLQGLRALPALRYGMALVAASSALGLRLLLDPLLGTEGPFLLPVVAVLLAAWYGGLGPGVLATAFSAVGASYLFLHPRDDFAVSRAEDLVQIVLFTVLGCTLSLLSARLHHGHAALRESEERYRALAGSLEQRVDQRTAQLAEANAALETFAYSVSHDLRAPLRGVQGFAQALLEDYGDRLEGPAAEYARRIALAADRMGRLIQDLLTYSRLSRAEVESRRVSLSAIVAEAWDQVEANGNREALRLEGALPAVLAHPATLVQVISNLLSNAVKFVPPGVPPRVRIWAEPRDGLVRLWIEDEGIGIAPEHQERIFDVFERLHGPEAYPGTGIGLAIVRKGVERMGGRTGVESTPSHGARFWIELPAAEAQP